MYVAKCMAHVSKNENILSNLSTPFNAALLMPYRDSLSLIPLLSLSPFALRVAYEKEGDTRAINQISSSGNILLATSTRDKIVGRVAASYVTPGRS